MSSADDLANLAGQFHHEDAIATAQPSFAQLLREAFCAPATDPGNFTGFNGIVMRDTEGNKGP